jgi:hypothetical protein
MTEEATTSLKDALTEAYDAGEVDVTPEVTVEAKEEESVTVVTEDVTNVTETASEEDEPQADLSPPENWSQEDKDAFNGLQEGDWRAGQEFLLRTEKQFKSGFTEKTEELAREREQYEAMDDVFRQYNIDPAQGINTVKQFLQLGSGLVNPGTRDNVYDWLNQQYPRTSQPQAQEEEYVDPSVANLVTPLQKEIQQLKMQLQNVAQSTTDMHKTTVQNAVDTFKNAKNDKGDLIHSHFDAVESEMAIHINSDPSMTLETAYDKSVWGKPELRKQLLEAEATSVKEKSETARKKKVEAAKSAEKIVKGNKTASASEEGSKKSLGDELRTAWDQQESL